MKWTTAKPAPARKPGEAHMTADDVIARLEDAGRTMMALPPKGWTTGARNFWPAIVQDPAEAYGYTDEEVRPAIPSAARITAMDEAFGWLAYIPDDRYVLRRIVGARALVRPATGRHLYSWRRIGVLLGCDHKAAQRWHAQGVAFIVAGWNGAPDRMAA